MRPRVVLSCLVLSCLVCVLASCSSVGPGVDGRVDVAPPGTDAVELTYLGTGGWIMRWGDTQLLTAPLYTHPGFLHTGLAPIRSDSALVDRRMREYDVLDAVAILVGHAHYDHLMDVPGVALRHAPRARIVGSRTVAHTLGTWSGVADRVAVIDSDRAADRETVGAWMELHPRIRVMPLRSHHAPHFNGMTLFQGSADRPRTSEPRTAREWLDGETFAFLIDFLDDAGAPAFRIYYQDAVSEAPWGFAPDVLMRERPVDVAIFVPATFDQVDWHPEDFIENLRPRFVLLGHWEDFFRPIEEPTRSVAATDLRYFEERLQRVYDGAWWRPDLGTVFRFPLRD